MRSKEAKPSSVQLFSKSCHSFINEKSWALCELFSLHDFFCSNATLCMKGDFDLTVMGVRNSASFPQRQVGLVALKASSHGAIPDMGRSTKMEQSDTIFCQFQCCYFPKCPPKNPGYCFAAFMRVQKVHFY